MRGLAFPVSCASELRGVRGIGDSVRDKVREIIETGGLRRLAAMENDERLQVVDQLCKVHGVGAVIANEWYAIRTRTQTRTRTRARTRARALTRTLTRTRYARGIRTIEEALAQGLMNEQQQIGARYWTDLQERIPRDEVTAIAAAVRAPRDPSSTLAPSPRATAC